MNPNTNTIMGSPIINATDIIIPIAPNSAPVGMAAPVAAVILAVILAASVVC